jgi:hypothetical protein
MAIDPRNLRPMELCWLLNSTSFGAVISERQLYRHRNRAGYRLGDGNRVDLLRYVAWLLEEAHRPQPETSPDPYETMKDRARARNAALALAGRDIGELPAVSNPQQKDRAEHDFRFFCEVYFPLTFHLGWSPDHLKVIHKIEQAVLHGGLFSMAMPRGSGKTTICECACIWATLYGHREFVCLIGSDEGHAMEMLESIKMELDGNQMLLADFPEVVFPIQCLEGIANRCSGQLFQGARTHIGWTAREVVLPTIANSRASGAIIKVAGITGRIRGMKFKRPDGQAVRPSLVVLDDPQTDESARSLSQCAKRESILAGAVLGLSGPGKKISGIMPCTVISPGDMADNVLDREKHPEWNGERTQMVYSFPTNEKLWAEYSQLRADGFRSGDGGKEATEFYRQHRKAMDVGATVAWAERFNHDELSAIQHAMNLKLQDEAAFFAEYQNQPLQPDTIDTDLPTSGDIVKKLNGLDRSVLPKVPQRTTMFIDVQQNALYYMVVAWSRGFDGWIVDYGTYPDQQRDYFTLRDIRKTLSHAAPGTGLEGAIHAGLEALTNTTLGREWNSENGAVSRIDRCLIDANWGTSTDVVYQFCRRSKHYAVLTPSHGRFVGAATRPFSEYRRETGDLVGLNWRVPAAKAERAVRHVAFDANWWKSFAIQRLAVALGDRGCLTLFGQDPKRHRLLADHLTAEYRVRTEGRGRSVDEWKVRPGHTDNHWFDCLVGCAVAASICGCTLEGMPKSPGLKKKRHRRQPIGILF